MKHMFLEKFFSVSRIATIRKEICGIRQHSGKTLHEYWERLNKLYATCPHHQISEQLLIQYFYEGLMMMDRSMIDAASGGALMDKTPTAARHLISNMASNTQQFGTRGTIAPRMVNEVDTIDNPRLENQLTELTSLVRQLAISQHQPITAVKACGICTSVKHPTDMCPTLQEIEPDRLESVGSISGYQYGKQPYANRPFEGQQFGRPPYRLNPNKGQYAAQGFNSNRSMPQSQGSYQQPNPRYQVPPFQQQQQQKTPPPSDSPSLEDLVKQIAASNLKFQQAMSSSNLQFQQNMSAIVQDLKTQSVGSRNLPSQIIPNPRGNASIVSLRSGRELQATPQSADTESKLDADSQALQQAKPVPVPFPSRALSTRKPESDEELLKMFRKVEINIPLMDVIKKIPKVVCAQEEEDEGRIPCTIDNYTFVDAILDLGASTNVMLTSIYKSLNCGDLEPTEMIVQFPNRSVVQPLGVLEDVLVQVDELIFPADFYVLHMEDGTPRKGSTLILGRPFLMTSKTKIDVHAGTLSMEFGAL
ncbi:hypothetical protein CR513_51656, partial [Mucuna pruriens]